VVQVGREYSVRPDGELLEAVEALCGREGYFVNRMRAGRGPRGG